jgi:hypothetical protein
MNTENQNVSKPDHHELVQSLLDLGAEWAKLGISFGTQALERSAKSLQLAAKTLETISKSFDKDPATETEVHPVEVVAEAEVVDEPKG